MKTVTITRNGYQCARCGHTWVPRKPEPKFCPRCKRDWTREKKGESR